MKARIYLSGPVLSIGTKRADKMFEYAEKCLISAEKRAKRRTPSMTDIEWEIINPIRDIMPALNGGWKISSVLHLIRLLLRCDAIMMLPEWEKSRRAKMEKRIAEIFGKIIFFFNEKDTAFHFSEEGDRISGCNLPPFCYTEDEREGM